MKISSNSSETRTPAAADRTQPLTAVSVQRKLLLGAVNDPMEFEADAMADRVMRMPEPSRPVSSVGEGIQRKCAHCEEEEKAQRKPLASFIQMKGERVGNEVTSDLSSQIQSVRGGGHRMPDNTKSFMESRFGNDFSNVRIHTDSNAVQLSRELNAQAFTVGNDVFFNQGKFAPESESGKHLLAHELTHTIQQGGVEGIRRSEAESSIRTETPSGMAHVRSAGSEFYEGTVTRNEYETQADQASGNAFHTAEVRVHFDPTECVITIPRTVKFVNHDTSHPTHCRNVDGTVNDPVSPVSESRFREVADRYLRANNQGLNDWFRLRITNAPNTPCNDRNVPIRVVVTEVADNPDTTVIITANDGRSYVSGDADRERTVLCDSPDYSVMMHEAGHMTLGTGDEYSERSRAGTGGAARERLTDSSLMAREGPARLQQLHERHFAFITTFMRQIYPSATLSLIYGDRSRLLTSFQPYFGMSGFGGDVSGVFYSIGFDLGIPLDVLRRTQLMMGLRGSYLLGLQNDQHISALLLGVRMGMQGTFNTTILNQQIPLGVGLHVEGGRGFNFSNPSILPSSFNYMELGGSLGYRGSQFSLGADAGVGALGVGSRDPQTFFRLGFQLGVTF